MIHFYTILSFIAIVVSMEIIELIRYPKGEFNGSVVTSSSYLEFTVILHTHRLSINLTDVQCHQNCLQHHVLKICTTTDYSQDCRDVVKSVYSYTLSFTRNRELDQALSFQIFLRTEQGTSMIEGVSHLLVEERNITWRLVDHFLSTIHQFVSIVEQQQRPSSPSPRTGWFIGSMTVHHRDLFLSLSLKDMRIIVNNDMQLPLCETSIGVHVTCCSLSTPRGNDTAGDGNGDKSVMSNVNRRLDSCLAPSADIGILIIDPNSTTGPMLSNYLDLVHAAVNTVRGTVFVFTTTMLPLSDTLKQLPASLRQRCSFVTLLDNTSVSDYHHHHHHYLNSDSTGETNTTYTRGSDGGSGSQVSTNARVYYSCTQYRVSHASMAVSDISSMQVLHLPKTLISSHIDT